jgi:hypothetical protein
MIEAYNVDQDRVTIHGLSNGAKGTWDLSSKRPDLFCAVLPMSGVGTSKDSMTTVHVTTPFWLFQGETDTNPAVGNSYDWIQTMRAKGGTPRYTIYPGIGHGTWNSAYAEPDFFSWILAQNKKNIYVFGGGSTEICAGGSVDMGFSAGFLAYQWQYLDNGDWTDIPDATTRFFTTPTDQLGQYRVRFQRVTDNTWADSNPVTVVPKLASTYSPEMTHIGSPTLPIYAGSTEQVGSQNVLELRAPSGYDEYRWFKDGVLYTTTSANSFQIANNTGDGSPGLGGASTAGVYAVRVLEPSGCESLDSDPLTVTYTAPQLTTPLPGGVTVTPLSDTDMQVTWSDVSGELYYEVWRNRRPVDGYSTENLALVETLPAGSTSFKDTGLRPEASYRYRIRAILSGGGAFSNQLNSWYKTQPDVTPPTAPTQLEVVSYTDVNVTLSWLPASDNDSVTQYEIFAGSSLIATIPAPAFNPLNPFVTHTLTGLAPGATYLLNVRAVDYKTNRGPFAEGVTVTMQAPINGLAYRYYQYSGTLAGSPNQLLSFNFNQTPVATGTVSNFSIAPRLVNDRFVFSYDGYIQIDAAGWHTFYTRSDDGSRLYIQGSNIVNNDGAHPAQNRSGEYNFPSPGKYAIRVTYFEGTGTSESLEVRYRTGQWGTQGNGYNGASTIPNNRLFLNSVYQTTYYSKSTGNLNDLSTWGTNSNGSGTSPADFTTDYQVFVIANRSGNTATLSSNWALTGIGSRVELATGHTLNLNAELNALINAQSSTIININSANPGLSFGLLAASSVVNFNDAGSSTIPAASYGTVNINGSPSTRTLSPSTTYVKGDLTVASAVTTVGSTNNASTLVVSGDANFSTTPSPVELERFSILFEGGTSHTINIDQSNLNLFQLGADFGDVIVIENNDPEAATMTFGTSRGGGLSLKSGSQLLLGSDDLVIAGLGAINPGDESGEIVVNNSNISIVTASSLNSNIYLSGAGNQVNEFTVTATGSGDVNINSPMDVRTSVSLTAGTFEVGSGNLRLLSDATGSARILPIGANASIEGSIVFQRYMEGEGRIYRYISSPVSGATVADLQQYIPVTGNFTGASTGPGIVTANPSMYHYDGTAWQPFPTPGGSNQQVMADGKGYAAFVRSDVDPTTWEVVGTPNQHNFTFNLVAGTGSPNDGWNLLGNPYASPIVWTGSQGAGWATLQNISQTVYVRENFNGQYRFRVYHPGIIPDPDQNQELLPGGVIAQGQAFWVQAAANPSLTITEQAKYTGTNPTEGNFMRTSGEGETNPYSALSITVTNGTYKDITHILAHQNAQLEYSKLEDAVKQTNSYFNLTSRATNGTKLAINVIPKGACNPEIPLSLDNTTNGTYTFTIKGRGTFNFGDKVYLVDNYLQQTVEITEEAQAYTFMVTSDAATKGNDRFVVRFEKPVVRTEVTLSSTSGCENLSSPQVAVVDAQAGVSYQAFMNGVSVSEKFTSETDGTLSIPIQSDALLAGVYPVTLKGGFAYCESAEMTAGTNVTVTGMEEPVIMVENGILKTNINVEGAGYQWYFDSLEIKNATSASLVPPALGQYQVVVSVGPCTKVAQPFEFLITGNEENAESRIIAVPNPFQDLVHVEFNAEQNAHSIEVLDLVGRRLHSQGVTEPKADLNLGHLLPGTYVVRYGSQAQRVVKRP